MQKRDSTPFTFKLYNPKRDISDLQREQSLKYCFMTSLQHIASAKFVSQLWMNKDVESHLFESFYTSKHKRVLMPLSNNLSKAESKVLSRVSKFRLPNPILSRLVHIVKVMKTEISCWIKYHNIYIFSVRSNSDSVAIEFVKYIVWTSRGVIDYPATARKIIEGYELAKYYKYKLACTYCLEDYIRDLAPKVLHPQYLEKIEVTEQPMVYFWTCHLTEDMTKLIEHVNDYNNDTGNNDTVNEYILNLLLSSNLSSMNQNSIHYMWTRLNEDEKSKKLKNIFEYDISTDLKCFLLSQLDWELQKEVFKSSSGAILINLLQSWFWQDYFFPTLHHVLDIMSGKDFLKLLRTLLEEIKDTRTNKIHIQYKNLTSLFQELWQLAPAKLMEYVFQAQKGHELIDDILPVFSWSKDINLVKLIFTYANAQQKRAIIFSKYSFGECQKLLRNSCFDLLETYIGLANISEKDIDHFKEVLLERNGFNLAMKFYSNKEYEKLDQLMNWGFKTSMRRNEFRRSLLDTVYSPQLCRSLENAQYDCSEMELFVCRRLESDKLVQDFRTHLSDDDDPNLIFFSYYDNPYPTPPVVKRKLHYI